MNEERQPFKKFTEGDFIYEIRRLNRVISKLSNERDELQQRIEKAIEFTTLRFNEDNHLSCGSVARLLSILKGEEK